ncbi:MAG: DegV family EDD domain-containing protein, partial [Oscillospiraceae bacterium]|nr:DegV family EDD domain-containing protein [Oscillospiraceae bacterium]
MMIHEPLISGGMGGSATSIQRTAESIMDTKKVINSLLAEFTGKSVEEMLKWAETEVDKFAVYYFADDLRFFARSGRVSGLAGTMGTLLGIRPIIYMGANGKMESIGKEKGRAKAVARLVKYAEELGDDVKGHRVLITCADAPELTEALVNGMREKFGDDLDITTLDVNPTIGSHCGPNSIGVCFHAIHR